MKDTSYTDTITAPNAIIHTYGVSSSKDGQTLTTLENSNGGMWIYGAIYLASSIVVQGYDKNANYDPSMCDKETVAARQV